MILWAKRAAAILSGFFLMVLLLPVGNLWWGMAGGFLNLFSAMGEKLPSTFRRLLPPVVLIFDTGLSVYGILAGGKVSWAVLAAGSTLFSWNASLFLQRWPGVLLPIQYRYLRRLGGLLTLGLGMGMSSFFLMGHLPGNFLSAVVLALFGGILFIRFVSSSIEKAR